MQVAEAELSVSPPERRPEAERVIDAIADCVAFIGAPEFAELLMHTITLTGAGQATAFAYQDGKARCLLSRNFLVEERSGTLAAVYVDGWYRDDPLFERIMSLEDEQCVVVPLADLLPFISSRYFSIFFGQAGWRSKISILAVQGPLRMVFNLYFVGVDRRSLTPLDGAMSGLYRLIGKLLVSHLSKLNTLSFPMPLAVLSDRERQVCIGMLAGKKAEVIAEEIGIGASSVVTYRQRAYQKLGISSRGQLFSICRS